MIGTKKGIDWYNEYEEKWKNRDIQIQIQIPITNDDVPIPVTKPVPIPVKKPVFPKPKPLPDEWQRVQMEIDNKFIENLSQKGLDHLSIEQFLDMLKEKTIDGITRYWTPQKLYENYESMYYKNNPRIPNKRNPRVFNPNTEMITVDDDEFIPYPFRSKIPLIKVEDNTDYIFKDKKSTLLKKKLQRISYSPINKAYEIDIFFAKFGSQEQDYLFIQNINTRFLYVYPVNGKSETALYAVLARFIDQVKPNVIKGDGEVTFAKDRNVINLFKNKHVETDFNSSKFIYHVKILDSTMKTIRDGFGINVKAMLSNASMQKMVNYYNNTINRNTKVTPCEMEFYPELETMWINKCQLHNHRIKLQQQSEGILSYQKGNILMIHLDKSKTKTAFDKRRRSFEYLGEFIEYRHGNVIVNLLSNRFQKIGNAAEIPIYFTVKVAENIKDLRENHKNIIHNMDINNEEVKELLSQHV
jgi:hypothetical protein